MDGAQILLVDDEEKILNIFSKQLVDLGGFSVETAKGGIDAVDKISSGNFKVVLLDLMMADKDGIEVLREIRNLEANPVVIILTNLMNEEQKKLTSDLGAVDYIIKTEIEPTELIQKIKHYLQT